MKKQCSLCRRWKDSSDFYKQSKDREYLRSECKKCSKNASHRYYEDNKEKVLAIAHDRYRRKCKGTA